MIQMVLFERPKLAVMHWRSDQWSTSHKDCLYEMFLNCGTTVALWVFRAKTKGRNFSDLRPSRLFLGGDRRT